MYAHDLTSDCQAGKADDTSFRNYELYWSIPAGVLRIYTV